LSDHQPDAETCVSSSNWPLTHSHPI